MYVEGTFESTVDEDVYQLTFADEGIAIFTVDPLENSCVDLQFYDHNKIKFLSIPGSQGKVSVSKFYVGKDRTFYVKVGVRKIVRDGQDYFLTCTLKNIDREESTKDNSSFSKAQRMYPTEHMLGYVDGRADCDYYKLTTNQTATHNITLWPDKSELALKLKFLSKRIMEHQFQVKLAR